MLAHIDGLSNVTYVGDTIYIDDNPKLMNIDGPSGLTGNNGRSIYVRYNDSLTNVDGLQNCNGTHQSVELTDNKKLSSVAGLGSIIAVSNGFVVRGSDVLADLSGVSSLQTAGYLTVEVIRR